MRLKLPPSLNIHLMFHSSSLFPPALLALWLNPLHHPRIIDDHPAFTVQQLLDVWRRGQGFQFLVDWEGYGPEERSWISCSLILDSDQACKRGRRCPLEGVLLWFGLVCFCCVFLPPASQLPASPAFRSFKLWSVLLIKDLQFPLKGCLCFGVLDLKEPNIKFPIKIQVLNIL